MLQETALRFTRERQIHEYKKAYVYLRDKVGSQRPRYWMVEEQLRHEELLDAIAKKLRDAMRREGIADDGDT